MEIEKAKMIFEELYKDVNGMKISLSTREKYGITNKSFVYGEVTFDDFFEILNKAKANSNDIFYDLGCGVGKPVIIASLVFGVKKAIGIELLQELVDTANNLSDKLYKLLDNVLDIDFVKDDILNYDFSDGTLIFTSATCFSDDFMEKLEEKFLSLKKESRIIIVTKALRNLDTFKLIDEGGYKFSWGYATVRIYIKIK